MKTLAIILIIAGTINVLFVFAACKAAGDADRREEQMLRGKNGRDIQHEQDV